MSLFDSIGKGLTDQRAGGKGQNNLMGAVAQLINGSHVGGLSGLAQLFNQRGQGDKMASWVSTGENRSISPEDVQGVLGEDRIREVASTAGVSEQEASSGLSSLLPQLIDKLTPDGKLPDNDSASDTLSKLAGRFLGH